MKKILIACALLLSLAGCAAVEATPTLMDDVRELASPRYEGRKTGTAGGRLARGFIAERFRALGLAAFAPGYVHPFRFTTRRNGVETRYEDAANVIAHVPGREPGGPWLVLSAHYDHLGIVDGRLYPGADDNASGVAVLLAAAAHFQANRPRHGIIFVAFDAEELGTRGARAFIEAPPVPLASIAMNLNLDMLARNADNRVYVAGLRHYPQMKPWLDAAAKGHAIDLQPGHDDPAHPKDDWTFQSDHGPFHRAGIPFLYFGVEDHPDYHGPGDTPEKLDPGLLARVSALVKDTARVLSDNLPAIARTRMPAT